MWQAVRPAGALVVEDADFEGQFCHPPEDAFGFWVERYQRVLRSFGGDPLSGRKLAARFAEAGIPLPHVDVVQRAHLEGEAKLLPLLTVEATAEAMIDGQVATAEEIEVAVQRLTTLAADSSTLFGSPRNFQVWTRRPPTLS
jgi:hypothetical protein